MIANADPQVVVRKRHPRPLTSPMHSVGDADQRSETLRTPKHALSERHPAGPYERRIVQSASDLTADFKQNPRYLRASWPFMMPPAGFEPATLGLEVALQQARPTLLFAQSRYVVVPIAYDWSSSRLSHKPKLSSLKHVLRRGRKSSRSSLGCRTRPCWRGAHGRPLRPSQRSPRFAPDGCLRDSLVKKAVVKAPAARTRGSALAPWALGSSEL